MKHQVRQLQETSWLAQTLADKMTVEFEKNGASARWRCLQILKMIVNEADDARNPSIYYDTSRDGKRQIIICEIPAMLRHGSDFDLEGVRAKLRGLAERYKDDEGQYLISVLTTHDLNSATVKDVSELMYQLGTH